MTDLKIIKQIEIARPRGASGIDIVILWVHLLMSFKTIQTS